MGVQVYEGDGKIIPSHNEHRNGAPYGWWRFDANMLSSLHSPRKDAPRGTVLYINFANEQSCGLASPVIFYPNGEADDQNCQVGTDIILRRCQGYHYAFKRHGIWMFYRHGKIEKMGFFNHHRKVGWWLEGGDAVFYEITGRSDQHLSYEEKNRSPNNNAGIRVMEDIFHSHTSVSREMPWYGKTIHCDSGRILMDVEYPTYLIEAYR